MIDTLQLKSGDKIGTSRSGNWSNTYSIQVVKSVSKTGQVTLENGDRFTKDGKLMGGSGFRSTYLVSVETVEKNIASETARRERNNRHAAAIELVEKTIRGHRNGHGDFFGVTIEERDAMIAAINGLDIKSENE
jgi:hypothetical protein